MGPIVLSRVSLPQGLLVCTVEPSLLDTNGTYRIVQYSEVSLPQWLLMCTVEPSLVDTNGTYRIVQYSELSMCRN